MYNIILHYFCTVICPFSFHIIVRYYCCHSSAVLCHSDNKSTITFYNGNNETIIASRARCPTPFIVLPRESAATPPIL